MFSLGTPTFQFQQKIGSVTWLERPFDIMQLFKDEINLRELNGRYKG